MRTGQTVPAATPRIAPAVALDSLQESQRACIESVTGERETRRRLLEMGLCPGVSVELVRRAPLGDPIEFRVRGYLLSLRRELACTVSVLPETGRA